MNTLDKHQLKILVDTVRNPDTWLLGSVNESEAKQILKSKFNYSDNEIKEIKLCDEKEEIDRQVNR